MLGIIGSCLLPNFDSPTLCEEIVVNNNLESNNDEDKSVSTNGYAYLLFGLIVLSCLIVRTYLQVDPPQAEDLSSWNLYWYSPRDYLNFLSLPRGCAGEMYNYWRWDKPQARIWPVWIGIYKLMQWSGGGGG